MSPLTQRLDVILYESLAGTLSRGGGSLAFVYDRDYAAWPAATPLSLSMPVRGRARHGNRAVLNFLRGLLPDNPEVLSRWSRQFGVRPGDVFGMVEAIGHDAPGAALYVSEGSWGQEAPTGGVREVDERAVGDRLRTLVDDPAAWHTAGEHWSLAGAQGKIALRRLDQGRWGVPWGAEPSTHIVKPGIAGIRGQALIEHVCMRAAAAVGVRTAATQYHEFDGQPAIVVQRFDRIAAAGGRVLRAHQEDLCQALAVDPARKYESDGGPGVAAISTLLRDACQPGAVEDFARAVVLNQMLGAPDAHAKNYAVLLLGDRHQLAPLYDVASGLTLAEGGSLRYPSGAMSIGGERQFGRVRGSNWDRFADIAKLPREQVRDWVRELADRLPDAVRDAVAAVPAAAGRDELLTVLPARLEALGETTRRQLDASWLPRPGWTVAGGAGLRDARPGEPDPLRDASDLPGADPPGRQR